jgi:hypothetical protein
MKIIQTYKWKMLNTFIELYMGVLQKGLQHVE